MKIGPMELIVVFIVALLVIGPNKLPEYAKKLGVAIREFSKATKTLTDEIKEDVVDPINEATKPIRDAVEPIKEADKEIRSSLNNVTDTINSIGKPESKPAVTPSTAESAAASEAADTDMPASSGNDAAESAPVSTGEEADKSEKNEN